MIQLVFPDKKEGISMNDFISKIKENYFSIESLIEIIINIYAIFLIAIIFNFIVKFDLILSDFLIFVVLMAFIFIYFLYIRIFFNLPSEIKSSNELSKDSSFNEILLSSCLPGGHLEEVEYTTIREIRHYGGAKDKANLFYKLIILLLICFAFVSYIYNFLLIYVINLLILIVLMVLMKHRY